MIDDPTRDRILADRIAAGWLDGFHNRETSSLDEDYLRGFNRGRTRMVQKARGKGGLSVEPETEGGDKGRE